MLESLNVASRKVGLDINRAKTQFMTNLIVSEDLLIDNEHIEQVSSYKLIPRK